MIVPVIAVDDVDVSLTFYTEKLGFKQDMVLPGPDGVNAFAGISLGQASFMLSREAVENRGQGVVFMVYLPDEVDIDSIYQDVQNKGVALEQELKTAARELINAARKPATTRPRRPTGSKAVIRPGRA